MSEQAPKIYTAAELKEKLGKYYTSRVHKNTLGASYKEVRNVLEGKGSSVSIIMRVMAGAQRALDELALQRKLNEQIRENHVA